MSTARSALIGLGMMLVLLPACSNEEELKLLRAENARLQTDVRALEEEVATLTADVKASEASRRKALSRLRETRLTLVHVARTVQDLPNASEVFLSVGTFRAQFCRGALKARTARNLARQVAAADDVLAVATVPPEPPVGGCNPNYGGCLKANAADYDCEGGGGDGPFYSGSVDVIGVDEYDLDDDGDGTGCE
jgi:hypothetical protein